MTPEERAIAHAKLRLGGECVITFHDGGVGDLKPWPPGVPVGAVFLGVLPGSLHFEIEGRDLLVDPADVLDGWVAIEVPTKQARHNAKRRLWVRWVQAHHPEVWAEAKRAVEDGWKP